MISSEFVAYMIMSFKIQKKAAHGPLFYIK